MAESAGRAVRQQAVIRILSMTKWLEVFPKSSRSRCVIHGFQISVHSQRHRTKGISSTVCSSLCRCACLYWMVCLPAFKSVSTHCFPNWGGAAWMCALLRSLHETQFCTCFTSPCPQLGKHLECYHCYIPSFQDSFNVFCAKCVCIRVERHLPWDFSVFQSVMRYM